MNKAKTLHQYLRDVSVAEQKLRGIDLTAIDISKGQPKMLGYIATHDGCMQKDIAAGTGIEPPSATSILAVMERNGLVRRVQSEEDRRRYCVFLTDKGREKLARITEIDARHEALLIWDFTPEERKTLFDLLSRLAENGRKAACPDSPAPEKQEK